MPRDFYVKPADVAGKYLEARRARKKEEAFDREQPIRERTMEAQAKAAETAAKQGELNYQDAKTQRYAQMGYGILDAADTGQGFDAKRGLAAAAHTEKFLRESGDIEGADNLRRLMAQGGEAMLGTLGQFVSGAQAAGALSMPGQELRPQQKFTSPEWVPDPEDPTREIRSTFDQTTGKTIVDPTVSRPRKKELTEAEKQSLAAAEARGREIGTAEGQAAAAEIVGSDAFREAQADEAKKVKEEAAAIAQDRNKKNEARWQVEDIDKAIAMIDANPGLTTGMLGGQILANIGGTPAHDLNVLLGGITADLSLDEMQKMRAASPTGSTGLGQVTEAEHKIMRDRIAAVEQSTSPPILKRSLERLRRTYIDLIHDGEMPEDPVSTERNFEEEYGL